MLAYRFKGPGQELAISADPATTEALQGGVYLLNSDVRCYVRTGADPTAAVNDISISANQESLLRVQAGEKISAVGRIGGPPGKLTITPVEV